MCLPFLAFCPLVRLFLIIIIIAIIITIVIIVAITVVIIIVIFKVAQFVTFLSVPHVFIIFVPAQQMSNEYILKNLIWIIIGLSKEEI